MFDSGCCNLDQVLKQKAHVDPDAHRLQPELLIHYILHRLAGTQTAKAGTELTGEACGQRGGGDFAICAFAADFCLQENPSAVRMKRSQAHPGPGHCTKLICPHLKLPDSKAAN